MTRIQTAKRNGFDPLAWLTNVPEHVVSGRIKVHASNMLLPWVWQERVATDSSSPEPALAA